MNAVITKVEGILKAPYSTENYLAFLQELFEGMQIKSPDVLFNRTGTFASYIEGHRDVGKYTDPDGRKLILLAVQLKKANYVENSRSVQRAYAKRLIENAGADAAIVAFYMEDDPKWRLSFVRLDYEMKFEHGRIKTQENMTPARRYSYLVGLDEPCHTAIERFGRYLDGTVDRPTLDDLEEAFSVEAVTNEFFRQYCDKFMQLRNYLEQSEDFRIEAEAHNFTSEQFAKKLMGQIVFLYFLQKKGWLGVNALPDTMDAAEFKRASFRRGGRSREVLPKVYLLGDDGLYHLQGAAVRQLSAEDDLILSESVKGKPWGTGPRNFMRRLFQECERKGANFYDDYLEPLFYNALNVNRRNQNFYDATLHCRIPFLSGGLFEPLAGYDWKYNRFNIPNELFSNRRNDGDREADGILDVFDRYNFTMSEDEPLEREVAIDPEMLGKVFENLLDVSDRKAKGAFYTPREIVHYMCQESLINYLTRTLNVSETAIRDFILMGDFMSAEDTSPTKRRQNGGMYISEELFVVRDEPDNKVTVLVNRLGEMDDALRNVRVVDPAVGSGAFPLGMLNEIVKARSTITNYICIPLDYATRRTIHLADRSTHRLKLEAIRDSIFAADIEPSAVDIARLRLWLSLVIDDELVDDPIYGHIDPLPLPNLECNIVCGNSLLDELDGIKLINQSKLLGTEQLGAQIDFLEDSFNATVRRLIEKQQELFNCDDTEKKQQLLEQIESLRDAIIRIQLVGAGPETIAHYEAARSEASKPYVLWQLEFARVFREKAGFDICIGNPPYVNVEKMVGRETIFRNYETCVGRTDLYIAFLELAAKKLTARNGLFSFIIPHAYTNQNYGEPSRRMIIEKYDIQEIVDTSDYLVFNTAMVKNVIVLVGNTSNSHKTIIRRVSSAEEFRSHAFRTSIVDQVIFSEVPNYCLKTNGFVNLLPIKKHIDSMSIRLSDICLIAYGARINNKTDKKKPKDFYITSQHIEGYKPFIEGRNITRYHHTQNGWLNYCPTEHYNPMFPELFENEKIIFIRVVSERLRFSYDNEGLYNSHTVLNCVRLDKLKGATHSTARKAIAGANLAVAERYNMKFLLAILNSRLINWYFMNFVSDGLNFYPDNAKGLPIVDLSIVDADQERVCALVDVLIQQTQGGQTAEEAEREIDMIVYHLYGLDEAEISVIEEYYKES